MKYWYKDSSIVQKFKVVKSTGKLVYTIFWDAKGIVHKEHTSCSVAINSLMYSQTLQKPKNRIWRIQP